MNAESPARGEAYCEFGDSPQSTAVPYILAEDQRHLSRLAYEKATSHGVPEVRAAILHLLAEHGPMTDDLLYSRYLETGYPLRSRQRVGTARHELTNAGKVREAGRGRSFMGNAAAMWEMVPNDGDG